jgi:hypothetical protein
MTQQPPTPPSSRSMTAEILIGLFIAILGGIAVALFQEARQRPEKEPLIITQIITNAAFPEGSGSAGSGGDSLPEPEPSPRPTLVERPTNVPVISSGGAVEPINCPGAYGPSFAINDRFVVPYGGDPEYTSLRSKPNGGDVLGRVHTGEGGIITGKPVCKQGTLEGSLIVWPVRTDATNRDGELTGWMAEGYASDPALWIEPD